MNEQQLIEEIRKSTAAVNSMIEQLDKKKRNDEIILWFLVGGCILGAVLAVVLFYWNN